MAIAFGSASGGFASGTASVTIPIPAGFSEGDLGVAVIDSGHPTVGATPTVSGGWVLIGSFAGGGGVYGAGDGPRRITLFIRSLESGDADPQFQFGADTESRVGGVVLLLTKAAGASVRYSLATGEDTTSGTAFAVTGGSTIDFDVSDLLILAGVVATDAATWTAQAVTAAGVTFGAVTEQADSQSGVGADASRSVATCSVTAGTATVAPVVSATLSAASTGVAAALRLRDVAADSGPGVVTPAYDNTLSRVRVNASGLDVNAIAALVETSTDQIRWTTVRGGTAWPVSAGAFDLPLDDYEFTPDVTNYYRVSAYVADDAGIVTDQETGSIVPDLSTTCGASSVWLKSIARPFLNQRVQVVQRPQMAVTRPARTGVFDVVGRTSAIAVNDVRKSRRWTMHVRTETAVERDNFDYLMASGDVIFIQAPASCSVPQGYVTVGDVEQSWHPLRPLHVTYTLPVVEVAPPGPDVVGSALTWQSVINAYPSWLATGVAHSSWADLLTLVGLPSEVIVP